MQTECDRLCHIMHRYCLTISGLLETIIKPTTSSSVYIRSQKLRNRQFDEYVEQIDKFNTMLINMVLILGEVVLDMNLLFIKKDIHHLEKLIISMVRLLEFINESCILVKLIEIQNTINTRVDEVTNMLIKIRKITDIILNICKISITVSTFLIPQLEPLAAAADFIKLSKDAIISDTSTNEEKKRVNVQEIANYILQIKTSSNVIIASSRFEDIYKCLVDKDAYDIIHLTDKISYEHNNIYFNMLELQSIIKEYKTKKSNKCVNLSLSLFTKKKKK